MNRRRKLGVKDSKAKEYLSDNRRFSEICNYMLFGGAKIIKPQDLKECDSTEVLSIFGIDRKQIIRQKWRDLLKSVSVKYTGNMYIVLIGIEAQTDVHYAMPVKTMMYDACAAALRALGDTVTPLVSSSLEMVGKIVIAFTLVPLLGYTGVIVAEPIVWFIMVIPLLVKIYTMPVLRKQPVSVSLKN